MQVTHDPKKNTLTIVMPCPPMPQNESELPLSATGKSRAFASSGGNKSTSVMICGKPLQVGLNAYIKA